jgi:sugar lactone lactonase YvrE
LRAAPAPIRYNLSVRRAIWILSALLAAAAVAAVWLTRRVSMRERPLDRDWTAIVSSMAGDGTIGARDGDAWQARFSDLFGVAVSPDGTIFISDGGGAPRIRRLSPDGVMTTIAGSRSGFSDGLGTDAMFDSPSGMALDAGGTLYVADTGNNAIRRVTPDGRVSTIARSGLNGPIGVAVDRSGRVIVADTYNDRIVRIAADGAVTAIAGGAEPGALDAAAADARFNTPSGVAIDASGTIYVADTGNGVVRTISPAGAVTTIAPLVDGLFRPTGIASVATGDVFVTDDRGRIAEIRADGSARIVAGLRPGFADGAGADARFRRLGALAAAAPGRLILADAGNALVRIIAAPSLTGLRAPPPPGLDPHFDADAFAWQPLLWPIDPMDGPHEIAGTMGEERGGEGGERFHAGIDVHADEGTPVRAVRDGFVAAPIAVADFGTLNESLRIGALTYVHLRVGRDRHGRAFDDPRFVATRDERGAVVGMRVRRGARFTTTDVIGTVNAFNHVHLNVGWPGEERNPLLFRLVQFEDTVPPTIARGGVRLYDEGGGLLKERVKGRLVVRGRVHIVVDAWDQSNGNESRRRLGLYRLGYQLLKEDGSPASGFESPRVTIVFDRLSVDPDAARLVYAPGSGIPFYGRRRTRFLYDVTNTFRDGVASPGIWDTATAPPGNYILRVLAEDISGNDAIANRDVRVTIVSAAP